MGGLIGVANRQSEFLSPVVTPQPYTLISGFTPPAETRYGAFYRLYIGRVGDAGPPLALVRGPILSAIRVFVVVEARVLTLLYLSPAAPWGELIVPHDHATANYVSILRR